METTDALLINPPREIPQRADYPPMGLCYLASTLKKSGVATQVVDGASLSWKKLGGIVRELKPQVAGIPCWTVERGQTFKTAKLVQEVLPSAKIIMGGHHATAFPEHLLELSCADAVVIGEGETTTVELVKTLLSDGSLERIKGIVYRENGKIVVNDPVDFVEDLDAIPFPSYTDFNLDEYLGLPEKKGRAAAIITSRGCPHRCTYCSASKFWMRKWRARSASNVLEEIEWLYKDYGVKNFIFFDDNFTVRKERVLEVCQGIMDRNMDISWVAESHVSHINKEILTWMKKSGCYRIDFGVESGSPKILASIKKGQTVEKIRAAFKLTHEAGIKPRAYLMVGNPGEDLATVEETVELMKEIKPHDTMSAQILWILPDTEIYELAKSKGLISDEFWKNNHSMVYYTGDRTVSELKLLRDRLVMGLAKNGGSKSARLTYLIRKFYYDYPFLQKLRKLRKLLSFKHV